MRKISIKKLKKKGDHIKYEFIYINMAGTGNSTETAVGERLTEARREWLARGFLFRNVKTQCVYACTILKTLKKPLNYKL